MRRLRRTLFREFVPWNLIVGVTVCLCAFVVFAGDVHAVPALDPLSDADIAAAVEAEMLTNEGVSAHLVDVSVSEGVVTLSGTVDNILAEDRAVRIAQAVKGVRSVINRIEVTPTDRPDDKIRADVVAALAADPATDSYQISTDVNQGVVTLTGDVDSWAERRLAGTVAKSVRGVRGLVNDISVTIGEKRPDGEIRADVKRQMEIDPLIDHELIDVSVQNGIVELAGTVGSASEKVRARMAAFVKGVKSVDADDLKVQWWARDKIRRKPVIYTDEQIEQAVRDAYVYDPRVKWFNPDVDVENGVVTLTGKVENLAARRAAEKTALNTIGVWRVRNLLRVRPDEVPRDEVITERVQNALIRDPYTERNEISVNTINGLVYLRGRVDSNFERTQAALVAEGVSGVVDVNNNLLVTRPGQEYKYDAEVEEDIRDQLWWSPFVDSDTVNVTVDEGTATLTGTVDSWAEFRAAAENAREAGATEVRNRLRVRNTRFGFPL